MEPLYSLSIFALFAVLLAWAYTRVARGKARAGVAASPETLPTASARLADAIERLGELEAKLKAHIRDYEDFEESVRRWQGRVNKQNARDAKEQGEKTPEDDGQIDFLGTPAAAAAPATKRGRLVPLSRMNGRLR